MCELLELIYLVFARPRSAFRRFREELPWWWAVAVFGGVQAFGQSLGFLTAASATQGFLDGALPLPSQALFRYLWVLGIPLALVYWFFKAAVWHLVAEFLGGEGRGSNLFFALGFAGLPLLVGYAATGLAQLAGEGYGFLAPGLWLLAGGWVLVLEVIALQEIHALSGGRALLVVALPLLALVGLGLAALAALGPTLAGLGVR